MRGLDEIKAINSIATEEATRDREWHLIQAQAWEEMANEPNLTEKLKTRRLEAAAQHRKAANNGE